MGKIIDYVDYLKSRQQSKELDKTIALVQVLHPKIESLIATELIRMQPFLQEDGTSLEEIVVTSLCFILTQNLITLTKQPNSFDLTEDNLDIFIDNIIRSMMDTFKKGLPE